MKTRIVISIASYLVATWRSVLISNAMFALAAGANAQSPPPCLPPPPNMVSWWPGDGNADDIIGSDNGTLQGGTTFAGGEVQQAFSFNGVDAYIDIPHNDNLDPTGPFSVDDWVKANPTQFYPKF